MFRKDFHGTQKYTAKRCNSSIVQETMHIFENCPIIFHKKGLVVENPDHRHQLKTNFVPNITHDRNNYPQKFHATG
jgi:hypothetical protein